MNSIKLSGLRKATNKIKNSDRCLSRLYSTLIEQKMILRHQKIILGLSGGPDSVFLFHAFLILHEDLGFTFVAAHFNHSLRKEADEDELFCKRLCEKHGIRIVTTKEDIRSGQIQSGMSPEEYARFRRHSFFEQTRIKEKADLIALAHHRDDLVETFLMRICAGSGLQGLASIRPVSGKVIHPLLWTGRNDMMAYLKHHKTAFRIDKSNADVRYPRNLFRHRVLPLIEKEYKNCRGNILRLTDIIREENRFFDETVDLFLVRNSKKDGARTIIVLKTFLRLDKALQRRVLMKILPCPGFDVIEIILCSVSRNTSGNSVYVNTQGQYVAKENGNLIISERPPARCEIAFIQKINLQDLEKIRIPAIGAELCWSLVAYRPGMCLKEKSTVYLDADKAGFFGEVRNRKAGDRIHGLGMKGSIKLKDLFINEKISVYDRWRIPVLELQTGIAAVFFNFADSHKFNYISQDFAVGKGARRVLCFHLDSVK